jgi:septum formation protein
MNSPPSQPIKLVLASASPYRSMLLQRLGLSFDAQAADLNESPLDDESIRQCAERLAREKAQLILTLHPDTCVLGSDQTCSLRGRALGKPGSLPVAIEQLRALSSQTATFHTAICVLHGKQIWQAVDHTQVEFRKLSDQDIEDYLAREPALDCAGSFMSERLGISLCDAIRTEDPTALIGLPLIATAKLLRQVGFRIP